MKFFVWRLSISEDFLKTLKVKKLVWPWRLGIHSRNMKREDFCFRSFIFSFLSHRKHRTVKGGRGNTKEKFPCDAQLKSYTYQSLRVKPLEISCSSVNFVSDRDEALLVSEEFVLTEELGIRQCGLPTQWGTWYPWGIWASNIRPLLCYAPAVPKYLIHPTVMSLKGIYVLSCQAAP